MIFLDVAGVLEQLKSTDIAGEVYSSLIVIGIIILFSIYIGIRARFQNPLKKPKGALLVAEIGVNFFENMSEGLLGKNFRAFGGYIMIIAVYLFAAFIFGLTGLPSPITYMAIPLSVAMTTFILIHATAVRFNKFRYFKRYIDPFPVFLPVNLISMWAPLLSMTLRLFGNALSGFVIMSIIYFGLQKLSALIFASLVAAPWNEVFIAPFITWIFHLYFDLWSGFIQTTVFISLTMIYVGQEAPEDYLGQ